MGYCLALGALPSHLLCKRLDHVLKGLVGVASNIESCEPQYTESRRDAITAICRLVSVIILYYIIMQTIIHFRVCVSVGVEEDGLNQDHINTIFQTLTSTLNDYTTDARGDIGVV